MELSNDSTTTGGGVRYAYPNAVKHTYPIELIIAVSTGLQHTGTLFSLLDQDAFPGPPSPFGIPAPFKALVLPVK